MKLDPVLNDMVDDFASAIKAKLLEKSQEGYRGFLECHMQGPIEQKLQKNFHRKDWVDVGALAAMRWLFTNKSLKPTAKDAAA
jgi:hypothetical protein